MRRAWTKEDEELLRDIYAGSTPGRLVALFPGRTLAAIRSKGKKLGIRTGTHRRFTDGDVEFVRTHFATMRSEDIARATGHPVCSVRSMANRLGLKKDAGFLAGIAREYAMRADHPMRRSWFKKGHVPANRGRKQVGWMSGAMIERSAKGRFAAGHVPANYCPVGSERVNTDGYIEMKVYGGLRGWRAKHRVMWEQHNGPIPAGYNVQFRDGNRRNCVIENLYVISRAEQMKDENSIYTRYPEDVRDLIHLKGVMKRQLNKIKKDESNRQTEGDGE
ncbi:MAG: HNH endonuclease [Tannerella sp.]|nr:HNH endonuclease [Tannerella sp.]